MSASPRPFPSLVIGRDRLSAQGSFAEHQREFLEPDPATVTELERTLKAANAGVVAHFYMDAELQAVLSRCQWPHVHISDSLLMADHAIAMADAGVRVVVVLGVDFMAENVRAMLDASGHEGVAVYRVVSEPIGCSLAEAADSRTYRAYLERARRSQHPLHVVYINTSLRTKAHAHHLVPTITCTSSNVVQTVLSAFADAPDLEVWFGPDAYMGANLAAMFERYAALDAEDVARLHPRHTPQSIARMRPRFHYYQQGICLVHHMFGAQVAERVRNEYRDAHVVAHLEVPGEMFAVGLQAQLRRRGVVGSTSDILGYIRRTVTDACEVDGPARPRFVLGTESGMITAIVNAVQRVLARTGRADVEAEIVFPVADDAVALTGDERLSVVPGVIAGEGCSVSGGCASCPYMKQNSLDALLQIVARSRTPAGLAGFHPHVYREQIAGRKVAELGTHPIVAMREFQRTGRLPADLLQRVGSHGALAMV
ncbi:MAG: hypothetical protein B7733_23460 [Myxococcales bacterium FL481]|nr:MAG: hypothetical protein B7733_23460 [Myxococcales bacterium FL481]